MKFKSLSPKYELEMISSGEYEYVVGIDEVGRGCFAGPVGIGGFLFSSENKIFRGVNDSKLLSTEQREKLHNKLKSQNYKIKYGSVEEIDSKGIGKVLHRIISEIIDEYMAMTPNILFLIDGQFSRNFGKNTRKIIRGDSTYYSIAAASILAKVERDWLMIELSKKYPGYFLHKNKGYATKSHREILREIGPSSLHRKSFLKNFI